MALRAGRLLKPFFRISAQQFQQLAGNRYGFTGDMDTTWHLFEPVARTLVDGFYTALDDDRFEVLVPRLNAVDIELRGIAYEGAGMGLMLQDSLFPWKNRLQTFLDGPGEAYAWLVYIGAGLVLPPAPINPMKLIAKLDPFLRWFVLDGYGFYDGFFSYKQAVIKQRQPKRVTGYGLRAYDHGLGRSLWFATGANVDRILEEIGRFPEKRQADIWGGIGLACAYAAGVLDRSAIQTLAEASGPHRSHMVRGAAIATTLRKETGSTAPHTDLACEVLCGLPREQVAQVSNEARQGLVDVGDVPAYEIWRQRLGEIFTRDPQPHKAKEHAQ